MLWYYEKFRDDYRVPYVEYTQYTEVCKEEYVIHAHQNIEVLYVEEGEMFLRICESGGDCYDMTLHAGEAMIINCNVIHGTAFRQTPRYYLAFIPPNCLMPPLRIQVGETLAAPVADDGFLVSQLSAMLKVLKAAQYESAVRDAMLVSFANTAAAWFIPAIKAHPMHLRCGNQRLEVIDYVCKNYRSAELTVKALAHGFGYSERRLSDIFNENVGMPPKKYIAALRINDACRLLLKTDDSTESIAVTIGYDCARSFYRAFLAQTGVTPTAYRESKRL